MRSTTASAVSGGTIATSLPSLATYIGSSPRISQAPRTVSRTGISVSRKTCRPSIARRSHSAPSPLRRESDRAGNGYRASTSSMSATSGAARAIAFDHAFEFQVLALRQNGHAVIADVAAEDDFVSGLRAVGGDVDRPFDDANAGGRDEDFVALAAIHHLGVAGDQLHAGFFGGLRSSTRQSGAVLGGQPFFQDEGRRQVAAGARRSWPDRSPCR